MKLEGHPQKQVLLDALERRRLNRLEAFLDNLMNELYITGALRAAHMLLHAVSLDSLICQCAVRGIPFKVHACWPRWYQQGRGLVGRFLRLMSVEEAASHVPSTMAQASASLSSSRRPS